MNLDFKISLGGGGGEIKEIKKYQLNSNTTPNNVLGIVSVYYWNTVLFYFLFAYLLKISFRLVKSSMKKIGTSVIFEVFLFWNFEDFLPW